MQIVVLKDENNPNGVVEATELLQPVFVSIDEQVLKLNTVISDIDSKLINEISTVKVELNNTIDIIQNTIVETKKIQDINSNCNELDIKINTHNKDLSKRIEVIEAELTHTRAENKLLKDTLANYDKTIQTKINNALEAFKTQITETRLINVSNSVMVEKNNIPGLLRYDYTSDTLRYCGKFGWKSIKGE